LYHVTEQGPRVCKAVMGRCPYGKQKDSHFSDQASAYTEYEKRLTSQYGAMGQTVANKVNESALQKHYRRLDKLETTSPVYKALSDRQKLRRYTPTRSNTRRLTSQRNSGRSNTIGSKLKRASSRLLRKQTRKFTRAITPNSRNVKKMLLVKYWMPDIRSKKWR
jgi:hypothetical protein